MTRLPQLPSKGGQGSVPLHQRVSQALREHITASLLPNEAIPPEPELEAHFGVSRATIRRAVDDLVDEGLLIRRQGAGTFVLPPKVTYEPAKLPSWSESIESLGQTPRTTRIHIQETRGPSWVREQLKLAHGELVVWIWRLRLTNLEPMSIMVNYVPSSLAPSLVQNGLTHESLYEELRLAYGYAPCRAEDEVEAKIVTDDEAALLEVPPGSPIIEVRRVAFLPDERPLEVSIVRSRADRYRYRAAFVGAQPNGVAS